MLSEDDKIYRSISAILSNMLGGCAMTMGTGEQSKKEEIDRP
jgi:hypothetical protein